MSDETSDVTALLEEIRDELAAARRTPPPSVPVRLRERSVEQSVDHIIADERWAGSRVAPNKHETLAAGLQAVSINGLAAEFGVYQGGSLTQIARFFDDRTVHAFDSFVGLPESWSGTAADAGHFGIGGTPPAVPVSNVEFHVGFFEDTVPVFAESHAGPFAFCHLDADLYSSTRTVLETLRDRFVPGTVIVFDEYFGYHGWQRHEHRAFTEFLDATGYSFEGLSIGHMNVAVRLVAG